MSIPTNGPDDRRPGERWSFNLPLVIGILFVFLVAVTAWVVASAGDDDEAAPPATTGVATTVPVPAPATTDAPPLTASPVPVPSITVGPSTPVTSPPPTTSAATTTPVTTVPPTSPPPPTAAPGSTVPPAPPGEVAGDLGVDGHEMQQPPCNGSYITIVASAVGDQATAEGIAAVLDDHPGSDYLRTDQTCPSLSPASGGQPIYVVYFGPFAFEGDACQARARGSADAYVRRLSTSDGPDHTVECP